jgi:large subunit ribosomal protein L15
MLLKPSRVDGKAAITQASLLASGVITKLTAGGVRLIGNAEVKAKLNFEVFYASKGAIAAVEKAGGSVKVLRPAPVEKKTY